MWNRFDQCRQELEKLNYDNGVESGSVEHLKKICQDLNEKYKGESFSRRKTERIVAMLQNVTVDIMPEDIFAMHYNHYGYVWNLKMLIGSNEDFIAARDAAKEFEEMKAFQANMDFGHVSPDWDYLLSRGISGVIEDLEKCKESATEENIEYYTNTLKVYNAIKSFLLRFSDYALAKNTEKSRFIAENLSALARSAPKTLAQGMQLVLIFYSIQMDMDTVTIRSLGGLDHLLYPLYKSDIESARFTKAELKEITKYFFWKISCQKVIANLPFYICGTDSNGNDMTNEFTSFLLETYREMDIYDPKIHVMYHPNMNKEVLRLILEMIREGKNSFVFINMPAATAALEAIGISKEDAKRVTVYGCYETSAEGTEVPCTCAGMINLAMSMPLALKGGKQFETFNDFYNEVIGKLGEYTNLCMDTIAAYERLYSEICPSLIMSPTYKNSRESGIDLYCGGAKYNNTSIVGAGLATLVDSLVAIKEVVFERKLKTLDEFRAILDGNWQNDEKLRLIIKQRLEKFGNDTEVADQITVDIYNRFADMINGKSNGRNGLFRCGMFSVDWRFWMGEKTPATPDGRLNGEPLSKNLTASIGQDKNGVTAYLNSLLKLDSTKTPDGYVADVVLHSSAVKGDEGMAAFNGLLITFMKKGGFSVHFNILSPEMLEKAQKEPEKYKNLQIRLCGWNVRFIDLDKAQQDEFILQSSNKF